MRIPAALSKESMSYDLYKRKQIEYIQKYDIEQQKG